MSPELGCSAGHGAAGAGGATELEPIPACVVVLQNTSMSSEVVDHANGHAVPLSDHATSRSKYLSAMLSGRWSLNSMAATAGEQAADSLPPEPFKTHTINHDHSSVVPVASLKCI